MTVTIAVLTISDGCDAGTREDRSGAAIIAWAATEGHAVAEHVVVPDESDQIAMHLIRWSDAGHVSVILTTGGTGLGPRDVTPEATRAVIEREAPGIAEALRAAGLRQTPRAALSRGIAGTRAATLIVNLPGSVQAVSDGLLLLAPLLPHIAALLRGDTEH